MAFSRLPEGQFLYLYMPSVLFGLQLLCSKTSSQYMVFIRSSFYLSATTTTTKHLILNMKFLILSVVIFLNLFSNIRSILQCFVKENSSNEQKNCIFPFTLDTDPDFAYNECTKIYDNSGKYWCSTKVSDRQDFGKCVLKFKLLHFIFKMNSLNNQITCS